MSDRPNLQISDLDNLITALDVNVVKFVESDIGFGWRLSCPAVDMPCIHYGLIGQGRMTIGENAPIFLTPHKLVVSPPRQPFVIDTSGGQTGEAAPRMMEGKFPSAELPKNVEKFVAGEGKPELVMLSGYFRTSYTASIDLFTTLTTPIVEQFSDSDELARNFRSVVTELTMEQIGMRAMTTALLKLVLVMVLRRFLSSPDSRLERFAMLNDPQVARAFAEMAAKPGSVHTLISLSQTAGLSRSVFMLRFARAFGCSPMVALRQLRMRQAGALLAKNALSIEQIARAVGYESRSSFFRAFRDAYGTDPSDYSRQLIRQPTDGS